MMDAALARAFEATWPAAEYAQAGGFLIGRGEDAGGRVSSARVAGDWSDGDIPAAVAIHDRWGQPPMFRALDDDARLIAALEGHGFSRHNPTVIMDIDISALIDREIPPVTAFSIWPPLAIQREFWSAGNIGPARQAVMNRIAGPVTSILGRIEDRAAGAAFAAIEGEVAMVHCIEVAPGFRRKGAAEWMMRKAAFWALEHGATRMALAVTRANEAAVGLYRKLGFREVAGYSYYIRPET